MSKAFDTVNHNIPVDKLKHYGIRGLALDWVKSYFYQRSQFVEYKGHRYRYRSLPEVIRCGVPQGLILGPLFFIMYVNDLCGASRLESILFADDTVAPSQEISLKLSYLCSIHYCLRSVKLHYSCFRYFRVFK